MRSMMRECQGEPDSCVGDSEYTETRECNEQACQGKRI